MSEDPSWRHHQTCSNSNAIGCTPGLALTSAAIQKLAGGSELLAGDARVADVARHGAHALHRQRPAQQCSSSALVRGNEIFVDMQKEPLGLMGRQDLLAGAAIVLRCYSVHTQLCTAPT